MGDYILEEQNVPRPTVSLGRAITATAISGASCFGWIGLIFGIKAIVRAAKVNKLYDEGQYDAAYEAAASANKLSTIALVIGIIGAGIFLPFYVICCL